MEANRASRHGTSISTILISMEKYVLCSTPRLFIVNRPKKKSTDLNNFCSISVEHLNMIMNLFSCFEQVDIFFHLSTQ